MENKEKRQSWIIESSPLPEPNSLNSSRKTFFKVRTLGSNGHHHPCLPSSGLFALSPQTVSRSCLLESFSRPPQVMIDDKLLRGRKHISRSHAELLRQSCHQLAANWLCGWGGKLGAGADGGVNRSLKGTVQHLMRKKGTSPLLKSAVNYSETCAVTAASWILMLRTQSGHLLCPNKKWLFSVT